MTFNKNRSGQILQMVNGAVYYINSDGRFAYAGVDTGAVAQVTLTGWTTTSDQGNTMWQTTGGGYINLSDGWRGVGTATYSARSAQSYVDEVIENNKYILQNNLLCARFAYRLSPDQLNTLRGLQNRLNARNKALMDEGLVQVRETSYPKGYADLANSLNSVMATAGTYGIGVVVSTTVIIVISAVVLASAVTAVYFAFKAYAAESVQDVKFSKQLTKTLTSKLTAEEWEQLKQETSGYLTKTVAMNNIFSKLSGNVTGLAIAGLIVGSIWAYNKFFKKKD